MDRYDPKSAPLEIGQQLILLGLVTATDVAKAAIAELEKNKEAVAYPGNEGKRLASNPLVFENWPFILLKF